MRRLIIVWGAIFTIVVAVAVSFVFAPEEARGQTTVNVNVGDTYFCDPSFANGICETNVTAGDTVTWNWVGSLEHTVTQCDPTFAACPPPGGFDSGTLTGAGSTFSETFNTPGTFEYQCNVHGAQMRGRVVVAAAQATPTATASVTQPTQTSTAGATTPATTGATAAPTAAVPAAVPGTGGGENDGGLSWPLVLVIASGVAIIASAGAGITVLRRR